MDAQTVTLLILSPFILAFVYAGIHEYRRYKSEGRATYGLVYDEETGTTRVTGIAEGEEAYDPEEFDPTQYKDPDIRETPETEEGAKPDEGSGEASAEEPGAASSEAPAEDHEKDESEEPRRG
ncbi:MAG: hypothetical protein RIG84_00110 [Roseovarius sp.]